MHYNTAKANAPEYKNRRKALRHNLTPAEATLWRALRSRSSEGLKFRRQQGIGPFILDFYCPEVRLCVELDGSSHDHSYEYDEQRTAFLSAQGIRVIRFPNEHVWTCLGGVVEEIVSVAKELKSQAPPLDGKLETPPRPSGTPPLEGRGAAAPLNHAL